MGDHLICIDCLEKLLKIDNTISTKIVCRNKSIFGDIRDFSKLNNVQLIPYKLLINYFIKNIFKDKIIFIIDTEPHFRLGALFGLIMPGAIISTNYRTSYDYLFKKFYPNIQFNHYDENLQEGVYIINLINNCINLFLNTSEENNKLRKITNNEFKNNFLVLDKSNLDFKKLEFHDSLIKKLIQKIED